MISRGIKAMTRGMGAIASVTMINAKYNSLFHISKEAYIPSCMKEINPPNNLAKKM
jgi:hypothetical protein